MAGFLTPQSQLQCPHGGTVMAISQNGRVMAAGAPVLRSSDTYVIVGCGFTLGPAYHPCVRIQWLQPCGQSQAVSDFAVTESSVGMAVAADNAAQGTTQAVSTQERSAGR